MRRALDWLVVDEGGRAAGVVPFTGSRMSHNDGRSIPEVCAKVLDALRGRAVSEPRGESGAVEQMPAGSVAGRGGD